MPNKNKNTFDYKLTRANRKTLAIYISDDGQIEVRAPQHMSKKYIDMFVVSKRGWINQQLYLKNDIFLRREQMLLNYGSHISLRGKDYPIIPISQFSKNTPGFNGKGFCIPPGLDGAEIKEAVSVIYRAAARETLAERVSKYSRLMGAVPTAVRITSARTRWGSCSGKNSVNFSWYIMMGSDFAIDYVVIHELAHIKEHNHSARFWDIVRTYMPNYQEARIELKALQQKIILEDW